MSLATAPSLATRPWGRRIIQGPEPSHRHWARRGATLHRPRRPRDRPDKRAPQLWPGTRLRQQHYNERHRPPARPLLGQVRATKASKLEGKCRPPTNRRRRQTARAEPRRKPARAAILPTSTLAFRHRSLRPSARLAPVIQLTAVTARLKTIPMLGDRVTLQASLSLQRKLGPTSPSATTGDVCRANRALPSGSPAGGVVGDGDRQRMGGPPTTTPPHRGDREIRTSPDANLRPFPTGWPPSQATLAALTNATASKNTYTESPPSALLDRRRGTDVLSRPRT